MPSGNVVMLALTFDQLKSLTARLGILDQLETTVDELDDEEIFEEIQYDISALINDHYSDFFDRIHLDLVRKYLDPNAFIDSNIHLNKVIANTLAGLRHLTSFRFHLVYDPIEVSEKIIIGIGLTDRYFPVFLDWTEFHGGSNDPFFFTEDMISVIDEIRTLLAAEIPEFADSVMAVAMLWY